MKASVIIVNLDGVNLLDGILQDLARQDVSGLDVEVIVVDNGSSDTSVEFIRGKFPEIKIIEMGHNVGFSPAVNAAARETDAKYIALLNNDCRLKPDWLTQLIEPLEMDPKTMCVGSLVLDRTGEKIDFHRGSANIFGWGFHRDRGESKTIAGNEIFRSLFACGAACAYDRNIFLEMGGFSEPMFAFFEDVEMGWRLNAAGYEVRINPASVVEHHHGVTVGRFGKGFHSFLTERNALANIYCNLQPGEAEVIVPVAMALASVRFAAKTGLHPESVLGVEGAGSIFYGRADVTGGGLKEALKKLGSLTDPSGAAIVEAVSDFGRLIPSLQSRRKSLEKLRKVPTRELIPLLGEPFRAVIGHEREESMILELEPMMREIIGIE